MALLARRVTAAPSARSNTTRPAFARAAPRRSVVVRAEAGSVNDDTFKSVVLESSIPVLVDFWAPWCGPCRIIAPIVDEIAGEFKDKVKCVKINTDESPNVASEYGIRSIPTIMVFKNGKKCDTIIGAVPKSTIIQTVEKYM
ncbi:hypothetical protein Agub_g12763 [Astrephomene gubernaculifera]|uniref:Thioredoxin domain-containing protein n=1 Tax=Astrephomene gubernaculifera TaxID=47775 RepID=A0AAD3E1E2_9CHLO|nr:hypothetical protein Agub_g12763 [Astrephomene gubernaculifera]